MTNAQTTETSLRVTRVIKAPREKVYGAWMDPESPEMKRFAPDQAPGRRMRTELHRFEPRVGGGYRTSMIAEDGPNKGTYTAYGRYLELVPNERIVQTHAWETDDEESPSKETKVTITFRDVPDGTEVTIVHEGLPDRETVEGHVGGWTEALENFAAAFASG